MFPTCHSWRCHCCCSTLTSAADPPVSFLKHVASELGPYLTELFNRSLATGHFPEAYKAAYITLRLKKPSLDSADVNSYQPISNLTVLSKLLERLVTRSNLSAIWRPQTCFRCINLRINWAVCLRPLFCMSTRWSIAVSMILRRHTCRLLYTESRKSNPDVGYDTVGFRIPTFYWRCGLDWSPSEIVRFQ